MSRTSSPRQFFVHQPLLVDTATAARLCGVSERHWSRANDRAEIGPRPVHIGERVLWRVNELADWVAAANGQGQLPGRIAWDRRKEADE